MRPLKTMIEDDLKPFLLDEGLKKIYKKNELLLKQGHQSDQIFFLQEGIVRYFYQDSEGKEVTRVFLTGEDLLLAYNFYSDPIHAKESFFSIEALTDVTIYQVPWVYFCKGLTKNHHWALYYIKKMEEIYCYRENLLYQQQGLMAKELYNNFLKDYPEVLEVVSNRVLSTFLNISQETLSRIKKKKK